MWHISLDNWGQYFVHFHKIIHHSQGFAFSFNRLCSIVFVKMLDSLIYLIFVHPSISFPDQLRYVIPKVSFGSPPIWMCPENLQSESPRKHCIQLPQTTSAGSLWHQGAVALLQDPELLMITREELPPVCWRGLCDPGNSWHTVKSDKVTLQLWYKQM